MQRYNGQLINQFANVINGNAAAGAQVTVKLKSTGATVTLYATDDISGATLANPLTANAKGYYGFYAPDGIYTLDVNISGTPQLEIQLQDIAALQAQFDAALANAGYIPVGTFAAGCTVSQSNGVVSDGSSFWRWDGALPKTVTAGSAPTPTGVGSWVLVSDGGFRAELAADDSEELVSGEKALHIVSAAIGVSHIKLLPVTGLSEGMRVKVKSFHDGWAAYTARPVGGGDFYYRSDLSKSNHNGGTIIAPEAVSAWDGTTANLTTLLNWTGSGTGCYVRDFYGDIEATFFGALPTSLGGNNYQNIPLNKALSSIPGSFGVVHLCSGVFRVSAKVSMLPAVTLYGDGAEATWIELAPSTTTDCVLGAEFTGSGADYIYVKNLTISGNKQNGGDSKGVIFDKVHVPSYLDDVTVLWCTGPNIEVKNSTVIQLNRVWSNGSDSFALDVDTVRSLHIIGGAYEHCDGGTAHIRIRNTGNFYYPQATISGGHIEGLLLAGMSGIEIGGGSEYYSVQGLAINGLQVLGKRVGGESNNYAIKILDDNCEIAVNGESHTGLTSFVTGARSGVPIPPVSAFSISNWYYTGNTSSGYRMPSTVSIDSEGDTFKIISQQSVTVPAYSQTEQGINIPTQPNLDYDVFIQVGGFMGANITFTVPEADKAYGVFKIKFVDITDGSAAQLENETKFKILVTNR